MTVNTKIQHLINWGVKQKSLVHVPTEVFLPLYTQGKALYDSQMWSLHGKENRQLLIRLFSILFYLVCSWIVVRAIVNA